MKPEVAHFTRERPCSKLELWQCFRRSSRGFATVQVDEAHSLIGKNAPRYMEKKGYLVHESRPRGDFYVITPTGAQWLTQGIEAYAKNHPSLRASIEFFPGEAAPARRLRRRA